MILAFFFFFKFLHFLQNFLYLPFSFFAKISQSAIWIYRTAGNLFVWSVEQFSPSRSWSLTGFFSKFCAWMYLWSISWFCHLMQTEPCDFILVFLWLCCALESFCWQCLCLAMLSASSVRPHLGCANAWWNWEQALSCNGKDCVCANVLGPGGWMEQLILNGINSSRKLQ